MKLPPVPRLPNSQFARYVCVGVFNTIFGYLSFVISLTLLSAVLPARFLYLTVMLASVLPLPLAITESYLAYKFLVFRTRGNYLHEWLKCFAVYGSSMVPGLVALSALTGFLRLVLHRHAAWLHRLLSSMERPLHGRPLAFVQHWITGRAIAGYIAGAVVIGLSTIYSFFGHKYVTFQKRKPV